MKTLFTMLTALALSASYSHAQETSPMRAAPPSVTVHAEAVIDAEPDQAEIDIGVVTQARGAPEAAQENAQKVNRVMMEVKKLLGKDDEVKTASYLLSPNYRHPQGGKPEIAGYTASNLLRIKTVDLASVGKLIDASMRSGANNINRLVFTLKDEHTAQLQALRLASQKAKAKAEEMAAALGLKITRILAVNEGGGGARPPMPLARSMQMDAATAAAPTPVEAGTIEVRSSVTLTGELGTK